MDFIKKQVRKYSLSEVNYKLKRINILKEDGEQVTLKIDSYTNGAGTIKKFLKNPEYINSIYWAWVVVSYFISGSVHSLSIPIVKDGVKEEF